MKSNNTNEFIKTNYFFNNYISNKKKMAALLPFLPALLSGALGAIPGIISLARGKGGKLIVIRKPHKRVHKKYGRGKRGRGVVADMLSGIPLAGSFLGPLVRSLGGRLRKRTYKKKHIGHGGNNMMWKRTYLPRYNKLQGYGLLSPAGGRLRKRTYKKRKVGRGGNNMMWKRTYLPRYHKLQGYGLLRAAGGRLRKRTYKKRKVGRGKKCGGMIHTRKGHYRTTPYGKRVHVKAAKVHTGRGLLRLPGLYSGIDRNPYTYNRSLLPHVYVRPSRSSTTLTY
jgi:hypothetical protein